MASYALLILDMLNTFDFPEAQQLHPPAKAAAKKILKLKSRCKDKNVPVIYLNDNFDQWNSDREQIFKACTQDDCLGKDIAEVLKPDSDDYFILKPKHSGFFATALEVLLEKLEVDTLILTGIAGNICVLFTANDAHMRDFKVIVPRDCVASNTKRDNDYALNQFKHVFGFKTNLSTSLKL